MAGRYGMSFARKLIEDGEYEQAVEAATAEIESGDLGPSPLFDRASAYELLGRYAEAVDDLERAIERNTDSGEVDPFVLDDAYFSALLAAAREETSQDPSQALRRLERYSELFPSGAHVRECSDWRKRLTGELPSLLDKTKGFDAV